MLIPRDFLSFRQGVATGRSAELVREGGSGIEYLNDRSWNPRAMIHDVSPDRSAERAESMRLVDEAHAAGKRVVFTNGCFDLLHVGHIRYLSQARSLGDLLVVGLNSDQSVRALGKGEGRPIVPEAERREMLLALRPVDVVLIFDEPTPLALIQLVRPQLLVKGGDWAVEQIVGHEFVRSIGGETRSLPFVPGHSTTEIVERIEQLASGGSGARSTLQTENRRGR